MTPTPSTRPAGRSEINRQNASRSTGPVTPEGKRRASLNALRHGLTGHTVVLPEDDLAAYQRMCAQFHAELKPEGIFETRAVQVIADTYWRLERIRAMENNLFALGVHEYSGEPASDPGIQCALAQAKSLDSRGDLFAKLSLYEQRLNRTLEKSKAELKQLQQARAEAREKTLEDAAQIRNLKEALEESWRPEQNGFEFSDRELVLWMRRRELLKQARDFEFFSRLPAEEAAIEEEAGMDGEASMPDEEANEICTDHEHSTAAN
jgi:hypothetical protein